MVRMVDCVKIGRSLPGLEKPPFPGDLGQRIFDHVSAEGYELWKPHMTILINHHGLNPMDPDARKILREQMDEFFFGTDAKLPEGWISPDEAPAADSKGAPRRK